MNKKRRLEKILDMLKIDGTITIKEIIDELDISDMTARRDLDALEADGLLTRIHGGAQLLSSKKPLEKTHIEKKSLNTKEKIDIAKKACSLIKDGDTIFIGPGSTTSYLAEYLQDRDINIVTNSLTVFEQFKDNPSCDLIFIGGRYRQKTKGFIGYFTQDALSKISVNKAFVGVNGIDLEKVTISDEEEGRCNETILNNATERYVLADHSKFSTHAFYTFFQLKDLTAIISDDVLDENIKDQYRKEVEII